MKNGSVLYGFHWDEEYLKIHSPQNERITFLSLEMMPQCNARCLYCFSGPELGEKVKNPLTLEEYKDIVRQGKELGLRTVVFPGVGEPTLDKNLKPLIEFNFNLGLISVIYTNGILDKESIQFFRAHDTSLIVKIDSLNKEHYEKLVGLPYERFKKSLDQIIETYKDTTSEYADYVLTRLAANTVVTAINMRDIEKIESLCERFGILYFAAGLAKTGWAKDNWGLLLGDHEVAELYEVASACSWLSSGTMDDRCGLFAYGITIDINGDLIGCPTARWLRFGNIRGKSLLDLIRVYKSEIHSSAKHYCLARDLTLRKNLKEYAVLCDTGKP